MQTFCKNIFWIILEKFCNILIRIFVYTDGNAQKAGADRLQRFVGGNAFTFESIR